ncbi:hypothetical protein [Streptomyces alkaliphilus]|uniref:Uncharacterized protein n=1 Tax=Streptomyces alkaliphilus TaxID=1472722 RepID=A0A7W3TFZ4_9ACTN|nr:hypothetical protein [Streptomyces alkaliphilus]MBB0246139.1 hypothetical protein [Streptomyces alkaliphilus]MQS06368.1 hypothetical protein [Streptomyces alkaliphilus]
MAHNIREQAPDTVVPIGPGGFRGGSRSREDLRNTLPGPARAPVAPEPRPVEEHAVPDGASRPAPEAGGCLFALSQPPLMGFLAFIAGLLLIASVHDLFFL